MKYGPTNPPRMQRVLMAAMAAAADRPRKRPWTMASQAPCIALKAAEMQQSAGMAMPGALEKPAAASPRAMRTQQGMTCWWRRSEEHTSELQSLRHLVCRLLLE